jgi:hypothetical protein
MRLLRTAGLALALAGCSKAPSATTAERGNAAAPAPTVAPGGSVTDARTGQAVELASLWQNHCAIVTFYRGFF